MANRRTARAVERHIPGMESAVRAAAGEEVSDGAVNDAAAELGLTSGTRMMLDLLQVGRTYYFWTTTWAYCGKLAARGADYIVLEDAACILWEGRTSTLHRTGSAPDLEVEVVGTWVIPVDVMGPWREWPHPLFTESR